jgi:uncharacterized protein YodC (DUF2158 family)
MDPEYQASCFSPKWFLEAKMVFDKFAVQQDIEFSIGDVVQLKGASKFIPYFHQNQMMINFIDKSNGLVECFWTEHTQPGKAVRRFVSFRFHASLLEAVQPKDVHTGAAVAASREST